MKKTIEILLFSVLPFAAAAQHDYISSSGNVILYSGSIERYSSPDIYVDATYHTIRDVWVATLQIFATGATNTEDIKNCLLQAVEDYLTALNGGTTFTLH